MKKTNIEQTKWDENLALQVVKFSKKYKGRDNYAVKEASFEVKKGEFHGFIGANGAGKTTTIKSLIGAYARYEGEIRVFGDDHNSLNAKMRMGYIPEAANFPKKLNTLEYITHFANLAGLSYKEAKSFAKATLEDIGLGPVMKKNPSTFSSGQKKKVLLAQALVNNPDLIIMDEPAANLDPKARSEFFDQLKELASQGKAILISSHILAELDRFVDSVTILDGGKVVYSGKTDTLLANKDMKYNIQFRDKESKNKLSLWAREKGLKMIKDEKEGYNIFLLSENNIDKIIKYIAKDNIKIKNFRSLKLTLQDAYDKFVVQGSVDTQGQHSKAGRSSSTAIKKKPQKVSVKKKGAKYA